MTTVVTLRRCSTCKKMRPQSDFALHRGSADKLDYRCRSCNRARGHARVVKCKAFWATHDPYKEHPTGKKTCPRCGNTKFVRDFSIGRTSTDGLQSLCKTCQVTVYQLSAYGCAVSEDARCAICGTPNGSGHRRLGIDHCHKTSKVRGVLCNGCNAGLGHFQDDVTRMLAAIEYLQRTPAGKLA